MKKTAFSALVLTLCALYSIAPLLMHKEFISGGWDLSTHISKAYQVSESIKEGVLYPRWQSMSNGGYGSPTTNFYSPLFYLITGVVNLIIPSLIVSLKVTIFAGFLMSGISMYIFLRNFCSNSGSLAGGIAYQLLPYHIFEFYMRETLAETFAFFWFPLVLYFVYKGFNDDRLNNWIGLAFSYAGLILTHIVTAYIFTFVMAAFALFLFAGKKNATPLLKFLLAGFFGLALSAIYFIPMFFERKFVHIDWLKEDFWNYTNHFLYLNVNSLNPLHIQLERIVILYSLLIIVSLMLIYYKRNRSMPDLYLFFFFLSVFAFSIFISTSLSIPLWELIPGMSITLLPWRWLMISTLATSILLGLTIDASSFGDIKQDRFVRISMAVFFAFVICNLYLSSVYMMSAEPMQENDLKDIVKNGDVIEFRPIWLTNKKKDFSREKWKPVLFKEGEGHIDIDSWGSHSRSLKVNASIPSIMRVSTFYYPGWTGLVNGREVPIEIEKDSGAMLINVPPGKNEVLLEFRDTPLRRGAKWVSIISLLAAVIGLLVARRNLLNSDGKK